MYGPKLWLQGKALKRSEVLSWKNTSLTINGRGVKLKFTVSQNSKLAEVAGQNLYY